MKNRIFNREDWPGIYFLMCKGCNHAEILPNNKKKKLAKTKACLFLNTVEEWYKKSFMKTSVELSATNGDYFEEVN